MVSLSTARPPKKPSLSSPARRPPSDTVKLSKKEDLTARLLTRRSLSSVVGMLRNKANPSPERGLLQKAKSMLVRVPKEAKARCNSEDTTRLKARDRKS